MPMTPVRLLILVGCMERCVYEQHVRLYWCVIEFEEGVIGVRFSVREVVVMSPWCAALCSNTLQWRWRLCVCLRWMYGTVVLRWTCTNSLPPPVYVCIEVCLNSKLSLVYVVGCNISYEVLNLPWCVVLCPNAPQWRWWLLPFMLVNPPVIVIGVGCRTFISGFVLCIVQKIH